MNIVWKINSYLNKIVDVDNDENEEEDEEEDGEEDYEIFNSVLIKFVLKYNDIVE